jgi:hypothetical protein
MNALQVIKIKNTNISMINNTNPISIDLIEKGKYKISFNLDSWEVSKIVSDNALNNLIDEINKATGLKKISETFDCSGIDAKRIKDFWDSQRNWKLCTECNFKWSECYDCVIKCDSPLERDLLHELRKSEIKHVMQRRIKKDGTFYEFPETIDFDNILTIPDFYIESEKAKLCIYADGHIYHERTERQALRDRNIDRELQKLGYKVLRYTGQEIRKDCSLVVKNIKANLD